MKGQQNNTIRQYENLNKKSVQAFNKEIKLLQLQYPRQFSLCLNLSCGANNSIERPLQIPQEMLSKSIDIMPKQMMQLSQEMYSIDYRDVKKQDNQKQQQVIKEEVQGYQNYQGEFMMEDNQNNDDEDNQNNQELNIMQLTKLNKQQNSKRNTKNVLRNFGNAQNQFILYHPKSQQIIQTHLPQHLQAQFFDWVRSINLINFKDYRNIWMVNIKDTKQTRKFKSVYKNICWNFYQNYAIPYIFSGRMNFKNKSTHLREVHSMMKGLVIPSDFTTFSQ